MIMIKFIIDFVKYPFDKNKENNKFQSFLNFLFKDYPAFLWERPNIWRVLVLPFLIISKIFKR